MPLGDEVGLVDGDMLGGVVGLGDTVGLMVGQFPMYLKHISPSALSELSTRSLEYRQTQFDSA